MVHVATSRRSRGDEAGDGRVDAIGCIGLLYPNFVIFFFDVVVVSTPCRYLILSI
jgi:hypothetical protein